MKRVINPTSRDIEGLAREFQRDLQGAWGRANSQEEYNTLEQYIFDRYVDIAQRVTMLSVDEIIKGLRC
jgi:hypothetical protein